MRSRVRNARFFRRLGICCSAGALVAAVGIGFTPAAYGAPRLGPTQAGTKSLAVNGGLDLLRDRLGATRTALSLTRPGLVQAPLGSSPATVATAPVGAGPIDDAVDQATDTIYVLNGGPNGGGTGKTMSVIDGRTCRASDISRCEHGSPTVTVGLFPVALAVDATTDTVYVANANGNTVSVVDGATCNAHVRTGCNQTPPKVHVGGVPSAVAVDPSNHTAYVVNAGGNDVSMINTLTCNASNLTGCHTQHPPTVGVGVGPTWAAVDQTTHTVYVTNDNAIGTPNSFNNGTTVSVFDASTCNATTQTGCSQQGLLTVGTGPLSIAVDESTNTVYTANIESNTVSVNDGRTCDAADLPGCATETSGTVTVGTAPNGEALYGAARTLYVSNNDDDTLSVVNTTVCNGRHLSACSGLVPPTVATGEAPNGAAVDSSTHTVYVPNGVDNNVSVIDTRLCDAADTAGCRHPARTGPEQEYLMVADPATDTIYATDYQLPQIDVLNGTTCRPKHVSGCAAVAEIPIPALVGAIDDSTHTLYASEYTGTNEVAVINTATCNAHDTTGCGTSASTITIGPGPGTPALNPATDTLYVPYGQTGRNVAVVNAATCNADVTSGCGQKPAVVRVGANTPDLAVSSKTDTIYAPSSNTGTVAVINGATCNGTDHSGCGHLAATVTVGLHPFGVAVDDATHTVYVANNTDGDSPGTVSIINAATCNGNDTAGCNAVMPTIEVGRSPLVVALNTRTDTLYVSDYSSAAVSVVNGSTCNATVTRGCRHEAPERAVGSQPFGLAVNPCHGTVYVADILGDGALSIFNGRP